MTLTHYFAKLLGLYLVIGGVAFFVRKQAMTEVLALFADNRPLIYIGAMVRILLGLAIILANNRWRAADRHLGHRLGHSPTGYCSAHAPA